MPVPRPLCRRAAALVVAAALAGGCGDDDAAAGNSPVPQGARTIEVVATNFAFEPEVIEVAAGEPIEVRLEVHSERHDFVVDEAGASIVGDDGDTAVGGFTAPEEPGEYVFYCSIGNHQRLGMEGTLVVGQATP